MSTIKVTNIEHASTANGGIQLDNAGHVTVDGQQIPTAGALGHRNLVINGGFDVAQRSTSRVKGNSYNALDRWATGQFQDAGHEQVSVSDSTVPTVKGIRVTSSSTSEAASGTRMALGQMIESVNCVHLAGKKVTLSFYIRFSNTTFSGFGDFQYYLNEFDTTADQNFGTTGATRANGTTLTNGSLPTTWTKYTKTITCGSAMKNLAPRFLFNNVANTTNNSDLWYEVSAVQVEEGEKATPFEHRSYGDELARCQRYFLIGKAWMIGFGSTNGFIGSSNNFNTPMRVNNPNVVLGTPTENVNLSSVSAPALHASGFRLYGTISTGSNINAYYTNTYTASAEL